MSSAPLSNPPAPGVSVFLERPDGSFLVGKRKGSHSAGQWWMPGGAVDPGESPAQAAFREIMEETGLYIDFVRPLPLWTYEKWPEMDKHYICVYFRAYATFGMAPIVMEPERCEEWRWITWNQLSDLPHDRSSLDKLRTLPEFS